MIKLDKNKVYYLACPYSHHDKEVMCARAQQISDIAVDLIKQELTVIEPIEMCHSKALQYKLPSGYDYWQTRDRKFIFVSDAVIVAMMPGWKESIGVADEIQYALQLGKEVFYLNPDTKELTQDETTLEVTEYPAEFLDVYEVLKVNEIKYPGNPWLKPNKFDVKANFASMDRHKAKAQVLGNNDEESGLDHLLHLASRALMLYTLKKRGLLPKDEEK